MQLDISLHVEEILKELDQDEGAREKIGLLVNVVEAIGVVPSAPGHAAACCILFFTHFTPDLRRWPVPLFLRRPCDRTPGALQRRGRAVPAEPAQGRARVRDAVDAGLSWDVGTYRY